MYLQCAKVETVHSRQLRELDEANFQIAWQIQNCFGI
jgi:hypothetical protein